MTRHSRFLFEIGLFLLLITASSTVARAPGIKGQMAPGWQVDRWLNRSGEQLDIDDFLNKVVYLFFFQSWCPGCHSHGFPSLQTVANHFEGRSDVAFVAIQTTFEGFHTNTASRALETVRDYELDIPVGHAAGDSAGAPGIMSRYRTGGTPWTVIIDRHGRVRYDGFSIDPNGAIPLIEQLLEETR